MKKSELFFSVFQVFVDYVLIVCAALLAYKLRETTQIQSLINKEGLYNITGQDYLIFTLVIAAVTVVVFAFEGLYNIRSTRRFWQETYAVFRGATIVLVLIIIGVFLQREWFSSRFIILAAWILVIVAVSVGRVIMHTILKYLLTYKDIGVHRVLLVGTSEKIKYFCRVIRTQ